MESNWICSIFALSCEQMVGHLMDLLKNILNFNYYHIIFYYINFILFNFYCFYKITQFFFPRTMLLCWKKETKWVFLRLHFWICWTSLLSPMVLLSLKFTIRELSSPPRFLISQPMIFWRFSKRWELKYSQSLEFFCHFFISHFFQLAGFWILECCPWTWSFQIFVFIKFNYFFVHSYFICCLIFYIMHLF